MIYADVSLRVSTRVWLTDLPIDGWTDRQRDSTLAFLVTIYQRKNASNKSISNHDQLLGLLFVHQHGIRRLAFDGFSLTKHEPILAAAGSGHLPLPRFPLIGLQRKNDAFSILVGAEGGHVAHEGKLGVTVASLEQPRAIVPCIVSVPSVIVCADVEVNVIVMTAGIDGQVADKESLNVFVVHYVFDLSHTWGWRGTRVINGPPSLKSK